MSYVSGMSYNHSGELTLYKIGKKYGVSILNIRLKFKEEFAKNGLVTDGKYYNTKINIVSSELEFLKKCREVSKTQKAKDKFSEYIWQLTNDTELTRKESKINDFLRRKINNKGE